MKLLSEIRGKCQYKANIAYVLCVHLKVIFTSDSGVDIKIENVMHKKIPVWISKIIYKDYMNFGLDKNLQLTWLSNFLGVDWTKTTN